MDFYSFFGKLAGVIVFFEFLFYYFSIIRGDTKPARATWLVYSVVGGIILASYFFSGATDTVWAAVAYFIGPLIVALLSIKYGVGGWTLLDKICLISAFLSLLLWFILKNPALVLLINILIDLFGLLPTIIKTYFNPKSEASFPWLLGLIANLFNLIAIEQWGLVVASYPLYMASSTGIVLYLSMRKSTIKNHAINQLQG